MNLYHRSTKKPFLAVFGSLLSVSLISPLMAQNNILKEGQEAKEMIQDLKEIEQKLRSKLAEDILEKREDTIDYLVRLERKYRRNDNGGEADSIKREIDKLRKQFEKNAPKEAGEEELEKVVTKNDEEGNDYVIYGKKYEFKSRKISGYLTFKKDNKVDLNYQLEGEKQQSEFTFQLKSNHLFLDTKSSIGKIYISEIPDTKRLAIMIRWGGEIKHEISTASIK